MLAATRRAFVSLPTVTSRASYATASATQGVQITTSSNGVKVASVEEPGQSAGLAVVVNGGSRLESGKNAGVAHLLKAYGFKNNANRTAFRIAREAELAGATLSSNLSHESIVYAAEFLKADAEQFAEILADVVTKQKFQDHEFVDVAKQAAAESASSLANPEIAVIEAAHQVAFRNGLGNSIFVKPTAHLSNAAVKNYAQQLFTQGNITLVGSGIEHEKLEKLAEAYFNLPSGESAFDATKYFGGESRIETAGNQGHYVLAFEGFGADSSEYAASQVLRFALGGQNQIQWLAGSSLLSQAAAKFANTTEIKAFNYGYSDAGLFGVYVSAPAAEASAAVAAAAEQLNAVSKGVSAEQFQRAVAQAKFAVTDGLTTRLDRLESAGVQALRGGKYTSTQDAIAALDKVTAEDVAQVANKLFKGKTTSVALGELHSLPYADSVSL
ncbi:ubiquinol-cytochrome c reductase core subunit 1 [Apophysomyces ossiformis]|uniref:Cytochrome b-c1 complex subunit 2, mitochondrial n=1 Tax=Apophysomyces ossiformis TaxID=679940 RepID=A0A8H7BFN9_9FUNG|nr:ubiquinol-cytochrome c reductase core subunit 1 [Apophysomyces ossiformis]